MASRPRPTRTSPEVSTTISSESTKSRQKANATAKRNEPHIENPLVIDGKRYVEVSFAAAELIPHGDWANISLGPAYIKMLVDPDDPNGIPQEQRENIARAVNEVAETVMGDILGLQRNIVLEALGKDVS